MIDYGHLIMMVNNIGRLLLMVSSAEVQVTIK